jgi:uncharacterized protein
MTNMNPMSSDPAWSQLAALQARPDQPPQMVQEWRNLFFAHAKYDAGVLAAMLPKGLSLQLFDGDAWLGFVPFLMRGVRPRMLPAMPGLSNFCETNLRTYVTHSEHGPGVWFFSLEASNWLACYIARQWTKLPYFHSAMFWEERAGEQAYMATRLDRQRMPLVWPKTMNTERYTVYATPEGQPKPAAPETLEYWLFERYRLYSSDFKGNLFTGRVWHEPYQVQAVNVRELSIQGVDANWEHFAYAPGFPVEVFGIQKV